MIDCKDVRLINLVGSDNRKDDHLGMTTTANCKLSVLINFDHNVEEINGIEKNLGHAALQS